MKTLGRYKHSIGIKHKNDQVLKIFTIFKNCLLHQYTEKQHSRAPKRPIWWPLGEENKEHRFWSEQDWVKNSRSYRVWESREGRISRRLKRRMLTAVVFTRLHCSAHRQWICVGALKTCSALQRFLGDVTPVTSAEFLSTSSTCWPCQIKSLKSLSIKLSRVKPRINFSSKDTRSLDSTSNLQIIQIQFSYVLCWPSMHIHQQIYKHYFNKNLDVKKNYCFIIYFFYCLK